MSAVVVATTDKEREAVFRLRYRIFAEYLRRTDLDGIDHEARILTDRLDDVSRHYYVGRTYHPIAALSLSPLGGPPQSAELCEFLDLERLEGAVALAQAAFANWLLVDPLEGGAGDVTALMAAVAEDALRDGTELLLTLCRPGLVNFYERLGFEQYRHAIHLKGIGLRCPLLLVLRDGARLKAIRSPLYRLLRRDAVNDRPSTVRLRLEPLIDMFQASQILVNDDLWLEGEFSFIERKKPRLFDGLEEVHIRQFMKLTSVISCKRAEVITRCDETSDDMFLIASGDYVATDAAGRTRTLGQGDLFGEKEHLSGLPRTETVTALTEGHVAALTAKSLFLWMRQNPEAGVIVAINLARIISLKL